MIPTMMEHMEGREADRVLDALSDVYAIEDVQRLCDRVCEIAVELSRYRVALLSLYFEDDVYIGLEGGTDEMRRAFFETARTTPESKRAAKRRAIWETHRIEGTDLCFIPEGSRIYFGPSFTPSPAVSGSEWRPNDRLMLFVRGASDEIHGVLSLDEPGDGRRPDPAALGPLRAVDRFMRLMGVQIHSRHLAKKLAESEERYAAVVEQGHDALFLHRDSRILYANHRLGELVGVEPTRLVGTAVDDLLAPATGHALPGEEERLLRRDSGGPLDVAVRRSTLRFGGRNAELVALADISERKRVFARLLRSQKMESVGTLASGVAHDFNNLLGGILGYASLLRGQLGDDHPLHRYVEGIEKAAERAAGVTRQLLGIVRDDEIRIAPLSLERVIEEVARLLDETLDPSITIETRIEPGLPRVVGDETQLHQVLLNVCINARDAMPRGGRLVLAAEHAAPGSDRVRLLVTDTGTGMDGATLASVFDPFFTTKEGGQGTGLGLYLAYRVIERHGGTIDLSSQPGRGTTVEITLPASLEASTQPPAPAPPVRRGEGGLVLLVDDEELMRQVAREMLLRLGYRVLTCNDGAEAVDAVERGGREFVCAIMDVAMPVLDGWEATRRIHARLPDLPIAISSGHELTDVAAKARTAGPLELLQKPYRLAQMRALMERVERRRAGAAR